MLVGTCTALLSFRAYVACGNLSVTVQSETLLGFYSHDFGRTVSDLNCFGPLLDLAIGLETKKERNTRKEKTKTRRATYSRKNRLSVTLCTEEVGATIFSAKNIKISNDRLGLTRSAILLVLFIVIHAVGNLHVFKGQRLRIWMVSVANSVRLLSSFSQFLSVSHASPVSSLNLFLTVFAAASLRCCRGPDDFNGYGYFYVRLYWTGFGLPANIVEEYILLSVLLHVFVGLKRTWDMKLALVNSQGINVLNLAITGLMLLTFMTIHLFQFRFGDTDQFGPYYIRPPPYLINFWGILSLNLFWTDASYVEPVGVRDIYVEA